MGLPRLKAFLVALMPLLVVPDGVSLTICFCRHTKSSNREHETKPAAPNPVGRQLANMLSVAGGRCITFNTAHETDSTPPAAGLDHPVSPAVIPVAMMDFLARSKTIDVGDALAPTPHFSPPKQRSGPLVI